MAHADNLRAIIAEFTEETGSEWGQYLLDNFEAVSSQFLLVKPKASDIDALLEPVVADKSQEKVA